MARPTPARSPVPSESVRVARIGAIQAVIVAVVAGAAGVAGTAGLRHVEHSNEVARKDKELQELKASSESEIQALRDKLAGIERNMRAVNVLLTAPTALTQEQCFERLRPAVDAAVPYATGTSFEGRTPRPSVGSVASRGGYTIRVLCDPALKLAVVTVAASTPSSTHAQVERIGNQILAALQ